MTIREEAYSLINELPEDSVQAVVNIMYRMLPSNPAIVYDTVPREDNPFEKLQKLREEIGQYDVSIEDYHDAIDKKYGRIEAIK